MDLFWDHFNSSLQTKTHFPKNSNFGCAGFSRKIWHTSTQTNHNSIAWAGIHSIVGVSRTFWNWAQFCPETLHTQIANHHIQWAKKSFHCFFFFFFFLSVGRFFRVPPSHLKVQPDHYKGPQAISKGHAPLLLPLLPWESVNRPMNFNHTIMVTQSLFMSIIGLIHDSRLSHLQSILRSQV